MAGSWRELAHERVSKLCDGPDCVIRHFRSCAILSGQNNGLEEIFRTLEQNNSVVDESRIILACTQGRLLVLF